MKIAIIGANGNVGKVILEEALTRNYEVTAIVHNQAKYMNNQGGLKIIVADAFDETSLVNAIKGNDLVISAFGPKLGAEDSLLSVTKNLINATKKALVPRLIAIGGAGSLYVAPGLKLGDSENFPADWKPISSAHTSALELYKNENELDWTVLSPAALFESGSRTGKYKLGKEDLIVDDKGASKISFQDYAQALLDEASNPKFSRQRFTIGY
ncbi:NAD(P)-dependent oxidoreductase [Clostridium tagluense]|uniref:NAD(P)-dependent oxidoreductase n=1 Tax=Clostridium tagluense TaxID=360422 RepID=UPI001CF4701E|nr:NAD(P)-dependent oxidoreductase [Clostridium tagluense]MCB2312161.1 NAD(P)-dependent oxidoreductase [Clostridium tagluense]MCB2316654.1 NAD(P)-dependent oxidoreductase [Clostridium tagluense]MCB2321608.1 NAD(P)-dependent oxidoreductase [Clostridium tagluense]MCB2326523.1 NAD(P)-dependent oxidoreductase [Clostridium tagluense]MCB2331246.1 NAD(P)-dependent oxidoreductase [Clostridium tagluense]